MDMDQRCIKMETSTRVLINRICGMGTGSVLTKSLESYTEESIERGKCRDRGSYTVLLAR